MPHRCHFSLLALLLPVALARAGSMPAAAPLENILHNTAVAVVVSLDTFTPDPNLPPTPTWANSNSPEGKANFLAGFAIHPPGTYTVTTLQRLKGNPDDNFTLHLPQVSSFFYGMRDFSLPDGAPVLLLLEKDPGNSLVPVDPYLVLIPLSEAAAKPPQDPKQKPDPLGLIVASLDDEKLRPLLFTLLKNSKDPRALAAAQTYANDPDNATQVFALRIMALNQDLAAIPLIAKLAHEHQNIKNRQGYGAPTDALEFYTNPKAVPLLNPLLLDALPPRPRIGNPTEPIDFLRMSAAQALRPLADKSSIPYLMYALTHDDHQQIVSKVAYYTLQRLAHDTDYPPRSLWLNPNAGPGDVSFLTQWWTTEQKSWNPALLPPPTPDPAPKK